MAAFPLRRSLDPIHFKLASLWGITTAALSGAEGELAERKLNIYGG